MEQVQNIVSDRELQGSNLQTQEYFINVGPQHPSTHGVLHLKIKLDGEIIEDVDPILGYIHRSVEKMCEKLSYRQIIPITSRMDYLSAHINNQAVALAVEKAMAVEVPPRARAIRILMAELTRIGSHQLWWGVMGMDLGALTPFFWGFRDREMITEMFEETCGTRLTMNYIIPGGVATDVHPDFIGKVKNYIRHLRKKLPEYDEILTGNRIFIERTRGVGYLSPEEAVSFGCTGPTARGSGVSCDIRKWHSYDGYDKLDFNEVLFNEGDNLARYKVRIKEIWESLRIIEQVVENFPEGEVMGKMKKVIKLPKGEFYQRVETARGELGVYIVSDGGNTPYRIKFRSPNFSNLSVLKKIVVGSKIADMVATMSTLDLVIPDIDR
ncbi:MAG: NADH-quinone oxidoreductase subunit D [Bacteroidetes bacterium]|nr:NADH-quinone oxidoreductase subunit D [Bacteroidota bacterium]